MKKITCDHCGKEFESKGRRTAFLSLRQYFCPFCKKGNLYPMHPHTRFVYWLVAIFLILGAIGVSMEKHTIAIPGFIAIIAIVGLVKDRNLRKLRQTSTDNNPRISSGFIQIPFLVLTILGIIALGGAGYFGITKYQARQAEEVEKKENNQAVTNEQREALQLAQQEIEKLKSESESTKKQQQSLEQKITQQKNSTQSLSITAEEIAPYLTGVPQISCGYPNPHDGSASLWRLDNQYVVVTNAHVLDPLNTESCVIYIMDESGSNISLQFKIDPAGIISGPHGTDLTITKILPFKNNAESLEEVADLNYKISSLRKCPLMPVGSPVMVTGYPVSVRVPNPYGEGRYSLRATTNGIISAHDDSTPYPSTVPFANYIVSAKIDSGNSGGIAFSKDKTGLCVLGLPTWLTIGDYDTQGVIQNINNLIK